MYTFLRRVMLAAALLVLLFATNTRVQAPCCEITAIDARTGIVTAKVKATSRTFQFAVKSPATLRSLKIGQGVHANLTTREVSLDGRAVCCRIVETVQSAVKISPYPPSQSVPGRISLKATVPAMPSGTFNRFLFSYAPAFGSQSHPGPFQSGQATIETSGSTAVWMLQPQPLPNLYVMQVDVQTFDQASMTLIADGAAIFGANMPNGGYIVLYLPGPCPAPATLVDPNIPFGWLNPITPQNSWREVAIASRQPGAVSVSTPVKLANCAIAGYAINDIVNNPQVRVRSINVSCVNCHSAWGWQQKSIFCRQVPPFYHLQTDPLLYYLLQNWKNRGCPD